MSFDWPTLVLQTVNVLVLIWLLQRFFYRPVLAAIDRRRAESQALQERALAAERKAETAEAEVRQRMRDMEADAARLRSEAEAEAVRRADVVMADARHQAERLLAEARASVSAERALASTELQAEAAGVATVLASRLLEVVAPGIGAAPFLAALMERLAVLDPAERAVLGRGAVRIEVAPSLSAVEREEWKRRLAGIAGDVTFADEPGLVAGARLVTPSAALEVSWSKALAEAREGMVRNGKSG